MSSLDDFERDLDGKISRSQLLKRGAAFGVGVSALGALADTAVAGARKLDAGITLKVWKAPHNPNDEKFFKKQFSTYRKTHPNVKVDYRVTPWASWNETYTSAFGGGSPPDIHYTVNSFFPKFAKAGKLVALDKQFGPDVQKWKKHYDPTILNTAVLGGHLYGLPFLQAGISFVWNKSLFAKAGLNPDEPPKTWNQVVKYAEKLTDQANGVYGYALMDNTTGEMLNFYPSIMYNYGAHFLSNSGKWVFDSPQAVRGINVLISMYQKGWMPKFGTFAGHDLDTAFLDGKVAMMLSYSSFIVPHLKDYPKFRLGVSNPPAGPAGNQSLGGVGFWSLATASHHIDDAWELAQFLNSPPVVNAYARLSNLFPARSDVHPFKGQAVLAAFAKTQGNYIPLPRLPFDYWSILTPQIEQAFEGQVSAQRALKNAADQINEKLGK